MCDVGVPLSPSYRLGDEENNSRSEMRNQMVFSIFTTTLEDLDFADDIVLLSSKFLDLNDKTKRMIEEAARIVLKLNAKKCKTLRNEFTRNEDEIIVNNEPVEDVNEFMYLGAIVDKEGGGDKDIKI